MLDGSQASMVRTSFIGISERTCAKSISFPRESHMGVSGSGVLAAVLCVIGELGSCGLRSSAR